MAQAFSYISKIVSDFSIRKFYGSHFNGEINDSLLFSNCSVSVKSQLIVSFCNARNEFVFEMPKSFFGDEIIFQHAFVSSVIIPVVILGNKERSIFTVLQHL